MSAAQSYPRVNQPCAWRAEDVRQDPSWIYELTASEIAEIIVYAPTICLGLLLTFRHGFGRNSGWIFLVIFCAVVHGIATMRHARQVGRVAVKALIYFEVVTTFALEE